jgi:cytochrome c
MKTSSIFTRVWMFGVSMLALALCTAAVAQDHATAEEVIAKVREAASALSKTGDLNQFNQKSGPWVWKDTYIFIQDCTKKVLVAHPIKPEIIGQDLSLEKDAKTGKPLHSDVAAYCKSVHDSPTGVWAEYWWPKPGTSEPSRKVTYHLAVKGTPYTANAGIYSDTATIKDLSKLSSGK